MPKVKTMAVLQYDWYKACSESRRPLDGGPSCTTLTYTNPLMATRCESIEKTIVKRRLFPAGAVARQIMKRIPSRVLFRTMAGGEKQRFGYDALKDLRKFRAMEG